MLARVARRGAKVGLASRIRLHHADASALQVYGLFDFVLAFWMVHEVPDQETFLQQVRAALKSDGHLALVEPKGHVGPAAFDRTVRLAEAAGFTTTRELRVFFSRGVLMVRRGGSAA